MQGRTLDLKRYRATSGERNVVERINAPIFLEAILAIETLQEPQSNLEEKDNPSILKDDLFSRINPSIFASIAPVLLDQSKETSSIGIIKQGFIQALTNHRLSEVKTQS